MLQILGEQIQNSIPKSKQHIRLNKKKVEIMPKFSIASIDPRKTHEKAALDKVFGEGNWTPTKTDGLATVEGVAEYASCKDLLVAFEDAGLTPAPEVEQL